MLSDGGEEKFSVVERSSENFEFRTIVQDIFEILRVKHILES